MKFNTQFKIYADMSGNYRWRLVNGKGDIVGRSSRSFPSRTGARYNATKVRDALKTLVK
jgi:uncharacterized protein YegP (UPF0339 family)